MDGASAVDRFLPALGVQKSKVQGILSKSHILQRRGHENAQSTDLAGTVHMRSSGRHGGRPRHVGTWLRAAGGCRGGEVWKTFDSVAIGDCTHFGHQFSTTHPGREGIGAKNKPPWCPSETVVHQGGVRQTCSGAAWARGTSGVRLRVLRGLDHGQAARL